MLNPTLFPNQKDLICKKKISYLSPALSIEDFQSLEVDFFSLLLINTYDLKIKKQ